MSFNFPFIVIDTLMKDEGFRGQPYKDSLGKTSIGFGRNLDDNPLTVVEGKTLLYNDVTKTANDLDRLIPDWKNLNDVRRAVLLNMAYNMGALKLLGFQKMLAAIRAGDFTEAARQMLDSQWAKQVGHRAVRLAHEMETGEV